MQSRYWDGPGELVDQQSRRAPICRPIQRHPERHPPWSHPICMRGDERLDGGDGRGGRRRRPNGDSGRGGNGAASLRTFGPAAPLNGRALPDRQLSPHFRGMSTLAHIARLARSGQASPVRSDSNPRLAHDPASHPSKTLNTIDASRGAPLRLRAVLAGTGRGKKTTGATSSPQRRLWRRLVGR